MKDQDLFEFFAKKATSDQIDGSVYSVSEITAEIKDTLISRFGVEPFWIKGETSNYKGRNAQGHIYFRLKDEKAVINMAFFKYANRNLHFDLEEGMQVLAYGRISLYEPHGSYQFVVEEIRPAGMGELFLRFERLKKKLELEGLFDESIKKEIPYLPSRIGIITSPTGAAIRDMIRIIGNRLPSMSITIFPVRVQGDEAKHDIEEALKLAGQKKFGIDVIIVGRGGGSIEELWAFNEEIVARAVHKSKIPVISAVGHETDFTICDFVADLRAATPSNAAELVVPHKDDLKQRITFLITSIASSAGEKISLYKERLTGFLRTAVLRDPMVILRNRQQTLDYLMEKSVNSLRFKIERSLSAFSNCRDFFTNKVRLLLKSAESKIKTLIAALGALNPHSVLERGYSIAKDSSGKIIKSHKNVNIEDDVSLTLHEGSLGLKVKEKFPENKKREKP